MLLNNVIAIYKVTVKLDTFNITITYFAINVFDEVELYELS